jgi:hypothetical protein
MNGERAVTGTSHHHQTSATACCAHSRDRREEQWQPPCEHDRADNVRVHKTLGPDALATMDYSPHE